MIIAIDFDGTLVDHRFPKIGRPVPGAFEWMKRFQELGARLILWTMRSDGREDGGNYLSDAVEFCRRNGVEFCRRNGVEFWAHNANPEQHTWTGSPKAYAHAYVDDAALGCPLLTDWPGQRPCVDWEKVGPAVEAMILARQAPQAPQA